MIERYQNRINTCRITIKNVSKNQMRVINNNIKKCDIEQKQDNYLLYCTQKNTQKILKQIKKVYPNLETTYEMIRCLMISEDNSLQELGFANQFNLKQLLIQKSLHVNFTDKVDVKVLFVVLCELESLNGLQNWSELQEIQFYMNNLKYIGQLENLTKLTVLKLGQNQINNLEPLKHLVNLTELDLSNNQIQYLEPLSGLINLINLDLLLNRIENIEPLRTLVNLISLDLSENLIENFFPIINHPNFSEYILE
ncbi:leucine-rich_repeat domain-containing protein [Hexamita inflata]|uniref:Leucine-rich repeat domain-containing protein n=1 Tax=Hexamita inflata TaxID=28002 RepID=A0AA86TDM3_9EUKA|nr:leucine-rich repeat domain-containing protein [Hexamita inflata]